MSAVETFNIYANGLEGALPESGLQVMRAMDAYAMCGNRFTGILPESGIRATIAVTDFKVASNRFEGALPECGFEVMRALSSNFNVFLNSFKGTLPDLQRMSAVTNFAISNNHFQGALPESGFRAVTYFQAGKNHFKGTLPQSSIRAMSAVTFFQIAYNLFAGALPEGLCNMRAVSIFKLSENHFTGALWKKNFTGALPESGIRTMSVVIEFHTALNCLEGALPESGLRVMRAMSSFVTLANGLKGALPEVGMRGMTAMITFSVLGNGFVGTLPESGLKVMKAVRLFSVSTNRFAGVLPDERWKELGGLKLFDVGGNFFQGVIPSALDAYVVVLGHNLLAGSIPQRLLGVREESRKYVAANAMLHEGTIPASASRITVAEIVVSFGHGLKGLLPRIPGTVSLMSLWENGLEGHLHQLHILEGGTLLVYGNDLSCNLPRHDAKPHSIQSLALVGNHFTQPRHAPAWIKSAEQPTDMFCVSNRQGKNLVKLLFCGGCLFVLATIKVQRKTLLVYGKFARARSAWYETCQQQNRLSLASCVFLPLYSNMLWRACTVVADHLRFHVVGMRMPLHVCLVLCLHASFYHSAARFHDRHVTQNPSQMLCLPREEHSDVTGRSRVYRLWILVCVLTSTPGILYSVAKAVPGFLHQVSDRLRLVINNSVALISGFTKHMTSTSCAIA